MLTLLTAAGLLGVPDEDGALLLGGGRVLALGRHAVEVADGVPPADVQVHDLPDHVLAPGVVDGHLHILGGGGGAGYASRIPELSAAAIMQSGTTACVGMPGVDVLTRPPEAMLGRAYALREEGPRTWVMLGGFRWPAPTLTGSLARDLYVLPAVVGVKVALLEHLATPPTPEELVWLLRELEGAAAATGKACLLHVHLGRGDGDPMMVLHAVEAAGAQPRRVQVTHVNYSHRNLVAAAKLAQAGCLVDINPLIAPHRIEGAIDPVDAVAMLLDQGVPATRITLSSDGNASVPRRLADGTVEAYDQHLELVPTAGRLVRAGVCDPHEAWAMISAHPARALGLEGLGTLAVGGPADVVALDPDWRVREVHVNGIRRVADGVATTPDPFRRPITDQDRGPT